MDNKSPQIIFEYPDYIPDFFEEELTSDLVNSRIDYKLSKKPISGYAAYEWIIPGIFSVYILKPYFEAFLSEAGKDHYLILKNWLRKLVKRTKPMDIKTVTSSDYKIDKSNTQSKAFSIYFQSRKNQRIKLMFDNELDENLWLNAADNLVDLIFEHYSKFPNDKLTKLTIESSVTDEMELYAIIDKKTHEWKFVDINDSIRNMIKSKNDKK